MAAQEVPTVSVNARRGLSTCPPGQAVADFDACWIDGRPVREADWHTLAEAGRLRDVRGAFALAWRNVEGRLSLARDAIGERSLFYAESGGELDRKSTRLNSSHIQKSRMPSSA